MELTKELLGRFAEDYKKQGAAAVIAENAVKNNGIHAAAERETCAVTDNAPVFSVDVDSEAVANQRQAGFCWDFSGLNFLRWHMEKKLDLPHGSFQLSQVYTIFYDKLEKSNFFMEQIVKYAGDGLDDRRIDFLLAQPQQDGGDWDPFCALVEKYGVVPQSSMPDTAPSKNTAELNAVLNKLLRQDAQQLRDAVASGKEGKAIDDLRSQMLSEVYRVLAVCFGEPPQHVDFEYTDSKKKYHADLGLTPLEFYKKYLGDIDLKRFQAVMNLPTVPFDEHYTIDMTHEVQGGHNPISYLNLSMDDLKALVIAQLKGGQPVWFGCDVTQDADFQKGILSEKLYDLETLFNITWTMDKAERFETLQSLPTHAMMIAGVDLVDDKPVRWKIENSWGATADGKPVGHNGYFIADDPWFDQYVFEVAISDKYLSDEQKKIAAGEAKVLPYWNAFNPVPLAE
ncbi:C1 family peptidase [Olsenella sp. YH-ols2217]|uniref:Aminopeptidase n=1 Tax=Kribbibacterium absianum TaxID=3044210 RepID=A0ABT6ZL46_9ACTN|nr:MULTISPECIES: C1 family peptidase [unclassified Olsenella]MDJ1121756.1 C1 family peptidase [Olsenella sp. YH-ols2216]MDJ1129764.1 C1 family peptidase [Olsenella sp. YH-ols2217]